MLQHIAQTRAVFRRTHSAMCPNQDLIELADNAVDQTEGDIDRTKGAFYPCKLAIS